MKQSRFFTIFITTNVLFILLQIHKHTQIIRHSYKKQELEQQLTLLAEKKEQLTHILCEHKSHEAIHRYAQQELAMKPLQLNQIKKITQEKQKEYCLMKGEILPVCYKII